MRSPEECRSGVVHRAQEPVRAPWVRAWVGILGLVLAAGSTAAQTVNLNLGTQAPGVRLTGAQANDQAGYAVASGDVNGDGVGDLIIGAPQATSLSRVRAGKVYVILGRAGLPATAALESAADLVLCGATGDHPLTGSGGEQLGIAVASGDINGDGFDDIVAGAYGASPGGRTGAGRVYVILGRATLPASPVDLLAGADLVVEGRSAGEALGLAVAVGRVNGDAIEDLLLGAPYATALGRSAAGRSYVVLGEGGAVYPKVVNLSIAAAAMEISGKRPNDSSGYSLDLGDFNGDDRRDLLIGAVYAPAGSSYGEAVVLFGADTLASAVDLLTDADIVVRGKAEQPGLGDYLGWAVRRGNLNRDRYDDLVIGAPGHSPGTSIWIGSTYVVYGDTLATGEDSLVVDLGNPHSQAPDMVVLGDDADGGAGLGWSVAALNLNGDGFDDLVAAAPFPPSGGRVYGVYGYPGLGGLIDLAAGGTDLTISGAVSGDFLGAGLAGGDFNGDGVDDLLLGASSAAGTRGEVYVVYGTPPYLEVSLSAPPARYGQALPIAVRLDSTSGMRMVTADLHLSFNPALLTFQGVRPAGALLESWSLQSQVVPGVGVDTLKVYADNPGYPLTEIGTLFNLDFAVRDLRRAISGEVQVERLSFNSGRTEWVEVTLPLIVLQGYDGELATTVVSEPGDTVRVRVTDRDLNADTTRVDTVVVAVRNSRTSEREILRLVERAADDSVFLSAVRTTTGETAGMDGDGMIATGTGDSLLVDYTDSLSALGPEVARADTHFVLTLGDADGNGARQAFDAARILGHAVGHLTLTGRDSLAANVDSLAPYGAITSYDAALVIRRRLGLLPRFPVQESGSANHPGSAPGAAKVAAAERLLSLVPADGYLILWADDRSAILSGDLELEGVGEVVQLDPELARFQLASRATNQGVRVAFAGDTPLSGSGPLLRFPRSGGDPSAPEVRGTFNGGALQARVAAGAAPVVLPRRLALYPSAPNPFNAATLVRFDLPEAQEVQVAVYNVLGQRLRTLVSGPTAAGRHEVPWDGRDDKGRAAATGVYVARLSTAQQVQVQPMVLLR